MDESKYNFILKDTNNTTDYSEHPEDYDDDTYFRIGYGWNESYCYDASVAAYSAIKAVSDGDMSALKKTFCAQLIESEDIENQAQAAFEFFDGNATFGSTTDKRSDELYDGNHDFRLSRLTDDVTIENY